MIKYMEITDLNGDQVKVIRENGWCVFTECAESSSYYNKGFSWANRIGYVIFSEDVDVEHIDSYKELNEIASYDSEFDKSVREILKPIEDKCYVFLVKNPANYHFEQVWTNKGLEHAKETAKLRFRPYKHTYYERGDYDKMDKLIHRHNSKVRKDTEQAIALLKENGFKVVSESFAALQ